MPPLNRRNLIAGACSLGGLPRVARWADDRPRPLNVVVTGGHPGDPEYGCGGTIARYVDAGHHVILLYLTDGVPSGKPKDGTRLAEAGRACEILGARPLFAGQTDGDSIVDRHHRDDFRRRLEAVSPDVVFTHWPLDHHADHRATAMLAFDAWSTLKKRFALFYYEVSDGEDTVQFAPTDHVVIDAAEPTKRKACFVHASQSPAKYYALQEQVTRFRGLERGCRHAEAFVRQTGGPAHSLPPD